MKTSTNSKFAAIECLEAFLSPSRNELFHATTRSSSSWCFLKENISNNKLLPLVLEYRTELYSNDDEVVAHSDLKKAFASRKIGALIPSYRRTMELEKASRPRGISLLSMTRKQQLNFENKNYFDRFLRRWNLPTPENLSRAPHFPLVIQDAVSEGAEGTRICRTVADLANARKKFRRPLIREYVPGLALGVTLLIGKSRSIFSSLRIQCSIPADRKKTPGGIQWIRTDTLSKAQQTQVNDCLNRLAAAFRSSGFLGIANVDFILSKRGPLFIECNPRFSGATAQLSLHPELFHGKSLFAEHIKILTCGDTSISAPLIPRTKFEGTTLEFGEHLRQRLKIDGKTLIRTPQTGIYRCTPSEMKFVSHSLKSARDEQNILLFVAPQAGDTISSLYSVGTIISPLPLYKKSGSGMVLNKRGVTTMKCITERFRECFP